MNWHTFFFLLFALIAVVFAVAVVYTSNIVRMAFYLTLSLGATSGLFFLAGADFVGAMQLMIYVGGTLVLLIFGVMLTAQGPFITMKTERSQWLLVSIVGGSLLLVLLAARCRAAAESCPNQRSPNNRDEPTATPLGMALLGRVTPISRLRNSRRGWLGTCCRLRYFRSFAGRIDWLGIARVSAPRSSETIAL